MSSSFKYDDDVKAEEDVQVNACSQDSAGADPR